MQIVTIVGARPQFIKAATVSRHLRWSKLIEEIIVHTGQHYDDNMSRVFFDELEIPEPEFNLGVGSGPHGAQTGRMLEAVEAVLVELRPDWVLVYGDTNTTLAASLAAAKLHIPVAHVEAGLRSFNRRMPEEINRVLTDHVSSVLFAPTETSARNLRAEGISGSRVHQVGDVMYDAALYFGDKAQQQRHTLERLGLSPRRYVLATIHRSENTDNWSRLKTILEALDELASERAVVVPLHPRTKVILDQNGGVDKWVSRARIIEPQGYLDMLLMEKNACLVVTDSGGVQKEAFFYEVPCVTLREQTEWVELVEAGWNRLVPPRSTGEIYESVRAAVGSRGRPCRPYGDGDAAEKIVRILGDRAC